MHLEQQGRAVGERPGIVGRVPVSYTHLVGRRRGDGVVARPQKAGDGHGERLRGVGAERDLPRRRGVEQPRQRLARLVDSHAGCQRRAVRSASRAPERLQRASDGAHHFRWLPHGGGSVVQIDHRRPSRPASPPGLPAARGARPKRRPLRNPGRPPACRRPPQGRPNASLAETRANRTHPRRSARLATALKAAGPTRILPSPRVVRTQAQTALAEATSP